MNSFRILLAIVCISLPLAGVAQTPLTYSKVTIRIAPRSAAPKPEATKGESDAAKKEESGAAKPSEILPVLPRTAKEFVVELRPPAFLTQKDFIAHQPFGDKEGMLILLDPPQAMKLTATNLLGKSDILLVKEDGLISQIAPDVNLRELDEPIDSSEMLRAFVFLKAGTAKASDIQPGDRVSGAQCLRPIQWCWKHRQRSRNNLQTSTLNTYISAIFRSGILGLRQPPNLNHFLTNA